VLICPLHLLVYALLAGTDWARRRLCVVLSAGSSVSTVKKPFFTARKYCLVALPAISTREPSSAGRDGRATNAVDSRSGACLNSTALWAKLQASPLLQTPLAKYLHILVLKNKALAPSDAASEVGEHGTSPAWDEMDQESE